MAKRVLNVILLLLGLILHLAAIWVLYQRFLPVARWYWESIPVRGVDLLNAATYLAYLGRNFAPLPSAWKYIFFNGEPLILDYPSLHFYLALPLLRWFTAVRAIQFWMLVSTFLYFLFSYLLYARLSKSRWLALLLGIFTVYSVNVYGALIWGGSVPYHGTQFFLPLTLYLLVIYFQTGRRRWFAGAALVLGLSQYGHAQVALSYGIILTGLSLLLAPRRGPFSISQRTVESILFFVLMVFIGLPVTGTHIGVVSRLPTLLGRGLSGEIPVSYQATPGPQVSEEVRQFYRTRIYHFFTDTHPWLFWIGAGALIVFLLSYFSMTFVRVLINRRKNSSAVLAVFWITVLIGYTVGYLYLYSIGIDLFHGGWFRVFWPVPMLVGMFGAAAFGGMMDIMLGCRRDALTVTVWLVVDAIFLALVFLLVPNQYSENFETLLYTKSVTAGGFPGAPLVAVTEEEQQAFAQVALPQWIPVDAKDYRLYSSNQVYNMWFNAFFDLPLARGYIDPPITDAQRWGVFLMDIALDNNVAVEVFDYPPEMAKNAARFVLDWNAIRYLAGETKGTGSTSLTVFSSYITSDAFVVRDEVWKTLGGRLSKPDKVKGDVYVADEPNWVRYLEVRPELSGPILSLTDAPSVLFIGDDPRWEIFIRSLAQMGVTSRELIPVKGPQLLDRVSADDLALFDAVVLYGYDYRNHGKAWLPIEKYVEAGGALFVDTGAEVKESESVALPAPFPKQLPPVFPISATQRGDLGEKWDVGLAPSLSQINAASFSPLVYDGGPWNVSYADDSSVDEDATVLMRLADHPVVASWQFGEGTVVWSGLNLPAHMELFRNLEESKLLRLLLETLVPDEPQTAMYQAQFVTSEQRRVSGMGTKGVLFKESNFPGWRASVHSGDKRKAVRIWRAGLGYPGVMWARIPPEFEGRQVEVEFVFRGALTSWIKFAVAVLIGVVLFDKFAFNGKVFGKAVAAVWGLVHKRVGAWWEREEE